MVQQRDSASGELALRCRRFPACRGARPASESPRTRSWDEDVERLVARLAGAPLTAFQALLLRLALVLAVALGALLALRFGGPLLADILGALLPRT